MKTTILNEQAILTIRDLMRPAAANLRNTSSAALRMIGNNVGSCTTQILKKVPILVTGLALLAGTAGAVPIKYEISSPSANISGTFTYDADAPDSEPLIGVGAFLGMSDIDINVGVAPPDVAHIGDGGSLLTLYRGFQQTIGTDQIKFYEVELDGREINLSVRMGSQFDIDGDGDTNSPVPTGLFTGFLRDYGSLYDITISHAEQNVDPIPDAGPDQTVECDGAFTTVPLDGSASSDPDGDTLNYEWSAPAGVILDDPFSVTPTGEFPLGPTLVTLTVTDGNGGVASDDILVMVEDTTDPVVVCTTDLISLRPPNHSMRTVQISVAVTEECSDFTLSCEISSNEPDDANGDGAFIGDVNGSDGYTLPVPVELTFDPATSCFVGEVELRAERDGADSGRIYSIVADVADFSGNLSTASCVVVVPHDRRKAK